MFYGKNYTVLYYTLFKLFVKICKKIEYRDFPPKKEKIVV